MRRRRWQPARSAARSPARGRRFSPGRSSRTQPRCSRPCALPLRAALDRRGCLGDRHQFARRADRGVSAMRYGSTRDAANAVGFCTALQQGLAPDGGLYVPGSWPALPAVPLAPSLELAGLAEKMLGPFLAGDALDAELGAITPGGVQFSRASQRARPLGAAVAARTVSRPDSGFQGLRRTLSRRGTRAHPARGRSAAQYAGGHLRRYRRRRGGRLSRAPGHAGHRALSQGSCLTDTGAPAHLLGRQCRLVCRARPL